LTTPEPLVASFDRSTFFNTLPTLLTVIGELARSEHTHGAISTALPSMITLLLMDDFEVQGLTLAIVSRIICSISVCEMMLALDIVPALISALSQCTKAISTTAVQATAASTCSTSTAPPTSPRSALPEEPLLSPRKRDALARAAPSTDELFHIGQVVKIGLECLLSLLVHDEARTLVDMDLVAVPLIAQLITHFLNNVLQHTQHMMIPLDALNALAALAETRKHTQLCLQDSSAIRLLIDLLHYECPSWMVFNSAEGTSNLQYQTAIRWAAANCLQRLVQGHNDGTRKQFCKFNAVTVVIQQLKQAAFDDQLPLLRTLLALSSHSADVQQAFHDANAIACLLDSIRDLVTWQPDSSSSCDQQVEQQDQQQDQPQRQPDGEPEVAPDIKQLEQERRRKYRQHVQINLETLATSIHKNDTTQHDMIAYHTEGTATSGVHLLVQLFAIYPLCNTTQPLWANLLQCLENLSDSDALYHAAHREAALDLVSLFTTAYFVPLIRDLECSLLYEMLVTSSLTTIANLAQGRRDIQARAADQGVLAACLDILVRGIELHFPQSIIRSVLCAVHSICADQPDNLLLVERAGAHVAFVALLRSPVVSIVDVSLAALEAILAQPSSDSTLTMVFDSTSAVASLIDLTTSSVAQVQIKSLHCLSYLARACKFDAVRRPLLRKTMYMVQTVQCLQSPNKHTIAATATAIARMVSDCTQLQADAKSAGVLTLLIDRARVQLPRKRWPVSAKSMAVYVTCLRALTAMIGGNDRMRQSVVRRHAPDVAVLQLLEHSAPIEQDSYASSTMSMLLVPTLAPVCTANVEIAELEAAVDVIEAALHFVIVLAQGGSKFQEAIDLSSQRLGDLLFRRLASLARYHRHATADDTDDNPANRIATGATLAIIALCTGNSMFGNAIQCDPMRY
jgi:hypothetical protein